MFSKLYHGTTELIAKSAPVKGIEPYDVVGRKTGEPVFASKSQGFVALTTLYGAYQAFTACNSDDRWAIVEVNTAGMSAGRFTPYGDPMNHMPSRYRTWRKSLEQTGLCAYRGPIPPRAISRIWIYLPRSNWLVTRTVLHMSLGAEQFAATQKSLEVIHHWLTGEPVTLEEWLGNSKEQFAREQLESMTTEWLDRTGLDIFYVGSGNTNK
jgi:hypothetical protein